MKAVILAGGEGKRLKSVTGSLPKPMVPLLGRPLMERCVELLRENGIRELCAALRYNPGPIMDYFGDGERFGVDITWRIETQPLGTAGGVKACMDFVGSEDFLVMSGDAACDFDLAGLLRRHTESGAAATVALYECPEPLRYGVAVRSGDGDVRGFVEKPDWSRVVSDLVSTGIYALSPRAMDYVPDNTEFDFAKNLFPLLLERGERIRGELMEGYWCDVGTPRSYYQCCVDALDGRLRLPDAETPAEAESAPAAAEHAVGANRRVRRVRCADRARLMRLASAALMDCGADFTDGLGIKNPHCAAHIAPDAAESAVVIETGAEDAEFSEELASALEELLEGLKTD